jgi:DNA mismatch endonuclease (patch repair protein)
VVVFCDGNFWHGRDLEARVGKLADGHNGPYWVTKITTNVARDRRHDDALRGEGWLVIRVWESEILGDVASVASRIAAEVEARSR